MCPLQKENIRTSELNHLIHVTQKKKEKKRKMLTNPTEQSLTVLTVLNPEHTTSPRLDLITVVGAELEWWHSPVD